MGFMLDVIISVPIGVLYNICIMKFADILTTGVKYDEKVQKNLIISFLGGLIGYIVVISLFDKGGMLENRGVKFGVLLGSTILILNTLFLNWNNLQDDAKLFIMGFLFFFLIGLSYKYRGIKY